VMSRNDSSEMMDKIMSIDPEKKKRVEDKQINVMVSTEKD